MASKEGVEMTARDAESPAPAGSDGKSMIGSAQKSANSYGPLTLSSPKVAWGLVVLFFSTTIVFAALYGVELNDDDSCDKDKIEEVKLSNMAQANREVAQAFVEGIISGDVLLMNSTLTNDAVFLCDESYGCPYESKEAILLALGSANSNLGLYLNQALTEVSGNIEWIAEGNEVVAHFYTDAHSHDHGDGDDDDGDEEDDHHDEDILEVDFHGAFIFHMETGKSGNRLISSIDYYESREFANQTLVSDVEQLVAGFLSAVEDVNVTAMSSFVTPEFVLYCDYSWCPLDQAALVQGFQNPNQEWAIYLGTAWSLIQDDIEILDGPSIVGATWDLQLSTIVGGDAQTRYSGAFVFQLQSSIQSGLLLDKGYYYEWDSGLLGLEVTGNAFMEAATSGDAAALEVLLADDYVFYCDFPDCPANRTSFIQLFGSDSNGTWAYYVKKSWTHVESKAQWHIGEDTVVIEWNVTTVPVKHPFDKSGPSVHTMSGSYVIHFAVTGDNAGRISDVYLYEWNQAAHLAFRNQIVAEEFLKAVETGEDGNLSSLVTEDFRYYCEFPGCPVTIDEIMNYINATNSISKWFNMSYEDIAMQTEWSRDDRVVTAHWNFTTPPTLTPWEQNLNIAPYPHQIHGARVFHFAIPEDGSQPPLITDVFEYDWDESYYWGLVNERTAQDVVRHMSDANTTALESHLADDFMVFCDFTWCPINKTDFVNWFSDENHTLANIFKQTAEQVVQEIEWVADGFMVVGHFNITTEDFPFHGAYVFHFKSDMAQPFIGESLMVSDLFFYQWEQEGQITDLYRPFIEQIGTNATASVTALGDYLHADWIGAYPSSSADVTMVIDKASFVSQDLISSGLQKTCTPENITFYSEYFEVGSDVPPGVRLTAMHHIVYQKDGQSVTETAEESHEIIFQDTTGFSGKLLNPTKMLYFNASSYSSGFTSDIDLNIIRSWWFSQSDMWNCIHDVVFYGPVDSP